VTKQKQLIEPNPDHIGLSRVEGAVLLSAVFMMSFEVFIFDNLSQLHECLLYGWLRLEKEG
jgi:hypothetical protein